MTKDELIKYASNKLGFCGYTDSEDYIIHKEIQLKNKIIDLYKSSYPVAVVDFSALVNKRDYTSYVLHMYTKGSYDYDVTKLNKQRAEAIKFVNRNLENVACYPNFGIVHLTTNVDVSKISVHELNLKTSDTNNIYCFLWFDDINIESKINEISW